MGKNNKIGTIILIENQIKTCFFIILCFFSVPLMYIFSKTILYNYRIIICWFGYFWINKLIIFINPTLKL